jgi:hypothetical protein
VIDPDPLFQVYVAEKAAANLVVPTHRHPQFLIKGITTRKFSNSFSTAC